MKFDCEYSAEPIRHDGAESRFVSSTLPCLESDPGNASLASKFDA
jgi:hypothetical protein